jgi:hypothetical protein
MRYPDIPRPAAPYPYRNNRPFVAGGSEWVMQARGLTRFPLLECDLTYRAKTWAQLSILQAFFDSVNGAAGRFTFVDFNGIGPIGGTDPGVPWRGLYVTQGDGVTTSWDLPTYAIKEYMAQSTTPVVGAGAATVFGIPMDGIIVGVLLDCANTDGTHPETVTVDALVSGTSFTATFATTKSSTWLINPPIVYEDGVAKIVEWNTTTPAAGHYGVKPGTGTDGLDKLYAGTAPADGTIVTINATCRRAMRRARFVAAKRAYTYNVPQNYVGETFTIAEVTK